MSPDLDRLVLRLRGLELVRKLLAERGATSEELAAHTDELKRVRTQLVQALVG
jgi:hypothetical protein